MLLAIAASVALFLGLMGIYGAVGYAVVQQAREIGIRVALGAPAHEVKRMFVRRGLTLAGAGVVIGTAAAIALARLMSSLLFGIGPLDPATYLGVGLVLICTAAMASYLPAHKAAAVDPAIVLRR